MGKLCSWCKSNCGGIVKFPEQLIKMNIDGSSLKVGEIIRDNTAKVDVAFAFPLCEGTNNLVEFEAAIPCLT